MCVRGLALACALFAGGAAAGEAEAQERVNWRGGGAAMANSVRVDQRGATLRAAVSQTGRSDVVSIEQQGRGHIAAVAQSGENNSALVRQFGQNNSAEVTQSGAGNAACLLQVGRNVSAEILQTGSQSVGIIQTSRGGREVPVEICAGARLGRGGVLLGVPTPSGRGRW